MELHIKKLHKKLDARGAFMEILRSEDTGPHPFGQISISIAKPGQTRGGHYHVRKHEWFYVLQGNAELVFKDEKTKEGKTIRLTDKSLRVVEMPIGVTHSFTNTGKNDLVVLIYISESYHKQDADTYKL